LLKKRCNRCKSRKRRGSSRRGICNVFVRGFVRFFNGAIIVLFLFLLLFSTRPTFSLLSLRLPEEDEFHHKVL
jgi:hypothetical protein